MPITCNICKTTNPLILFRQKDLWHPIDYWQCQNCLSQERHRLMWKVFNQITVSKDTMLYCSPMSCLETKFKNIFTTYTSIDYPPRETESGVALAQLNMDLTKMSFEDESFDFIVCSHVIDQIQNEPDAIKELWRVLKPDGIIFLIVPMYPIKKTEEIDIPIINHYRKPGNDYYERYLKLFNVVKYKDAETLGVLKRA